METPAGYTVFVRRVGHVRRSSPGYFNARLEVATTRIFLIFSRQTDTAM